MTASRTIRKNSKEFEAAIASATAIKAFSLDNGFSGAAVEVFPAWIGRDFRLYAEGDTYKAHVHSNLWYEFRRAA